MLRLARDYEELARRAERRLKRKPRGRHDLTVWLAISAFSCFRVTSPSPRLLRPEIHHIHRPTDLPDVYAGIGLDSHPYDATFDVFLALPPVPAELHALS